MTEWETTQDRVEMIHKAAREQNYLDRKERTETRLYNAGGLPVSLILPVGEHTYDLVNHIALINIGWLEGSHGTD